MLKASFLMLLLCIIPHAYAQRYDLVITNRGDSIACRIDSITDAEVYLNMKYNKKWLHLGFSKDEILGYEYNAIDENVVLFKQGTSYIQLYDENDPALVKAMKLQRSGRNTTIVGASILGASALTAAVFFLGEISLGVVGISILTGGAGFGTMIVGVAKNETGKNRIERITSNIDTSFNGIAFELKPCVHYIPVTQNFQPGVMLSIRF